MNDYGPEPDDAEPPEEFEDREPRDDDEPPEDFDDREPRDPEEPPEDFEDPADYQPDDYEPNEEDFEDRPEWLDELDFEDHEQQIYEDAVEQFTKVRLQSYYLANPKLGEPALQTLNDAQSLLNAHPQAALVFATTAMELALKVVLLKPIVSGLVHTEGMAGFITDLATQHTGMERFQDLLTKIFADFGQVDLKSYKRPGSKGTLWQEMADVQRARNALIHKGEKARESMAHLAVAVAATLLQRIFPTVLKRLDLHLEKPITIRSGQEQRTAPTPGAS
jgi:hypothetical protein